MIAWLYPQVYYYLKLTIIYVYYTSEKVHSHIGCFYVIKKLKLDSGEHIYFGDAYHTFCVYMQLYGVRPRAVLKRMTGISYHYAHRFGFQHAIFGHALVSKIVTVTVLTHPPQKSILMLNYVLGIFKMRG